MGGQNPISSRFSTISRNARAQANTASADHDYDPHENFVVARHTNYQKPRVKSPMSQTIGTRQAAPRPPRGNLKTAHPSRRPDPKDFVSLYQMPYGQQTLRTKKSAASLGRRNIQILNPQSQSSLQPPHFVPDNRDSATTFATTQNNFSQVAHQMRDKMEAQQNTADFNAPEQVANEPPLDQQQ